MVGEIGVAWANANEHCFENCDEVVITPEHPKAETGRQCINCKPNGSYSPRDAEALFEETCSNCGTYPASIAYTRGYIETAPQIVLWPRAITTMSIITLVNALFILLLYKELKLATFDAGLAAALGFRPGLLHYILMALVSVTAVGAFDAVGAVLVVAFFIVPAATAYLLTDRLWGMLALSSGIGALSAYTGYDLARGEFLGIYNLDNLLVFLDKNVLDLGGNTTWDVNIASAMVMMTGFFFLLAWVISPRYGLISSMVRRAVQRRQFREQLLLMHIHNHEHAENASHELALETLHTHLNWSENSLRGW
ncbi:MAG: metal ABC transporter permease [Anaerolineae bacterium]|nr:metal ABC transporter permease [Anaerolineae bacterium]